MSAPGDDQRLKETIQQALDWTRRLQFRPKKNQHENGGLRYTGINRDYPQDADLSVTAWHTMFYRSAKNAGFEVPERFVHGALKYVRRCHIPKDSLYRHLGVFTYMIETPQMASHAMTGCGVLSLAMGGQADDPMCVDAGEWLLAHPIRSYDDVARFHYATYYCTLATAQLGGKYWKGFFPSLVEAMLDGQQPDGSWRSAHDTTHDFGACYPTTMALLALGQAYQLLPIYQN